MDPQGSFINQVKMAGGRGRGEFSKIVHNKGDGVKISKKPVYTNPRVYFVKCSINGLG